VIGKVGENKNKNPKRGNFNIFVLFFSSKCTKYRLQRSPDSLAGFKGPTSKGREGEVEVEEGKKEWGGKGNMRHWP